MLIAPVEIGIMPATATTSPFVDWPQELRLSVLELLPLADLLALSRVNKQFHIFTERALYAKVALTWVMDREPPLTLLLRTILDSPQLGHHVRSLRLDGHRFSKKARRIDTVPPPLSVDDLVISKASQFIRSTRVPQAQLWQDELQSDGNLDAIVALLLSMLPNLTSLHLGPAFTIDSRLLGIVLRCALCGPRDRYCLPTFEHLRRVTFSRRAHEEWHPKAANNASDVLPFFYLTGIQSLSVSIDTPLEFSWPAPASPAPSSLTRLELGRLRETRLAPVLSALDGLQKLHWNWYYEPDLDRDVSEDVVEVDTMAEALGLVSDSLTDLTIDAETLPDLSDGGYEEPEVQIRGSLLDGGLARLGKLRRLCVPWAFLMGLSPSTARKLEGVLPPSLEVLNLTIDLLSAPVEAWYWDEDSIISEVKSWFQNPTGSLLMLGKLRCIILPLYVDDVTEEMVTELRRLGSHSGVRLEYTDAWIDRDKLRRYCLAIRS